MAKIKFDEVGDRLFETGISDVVVFPLADTATQFTVGTIQYKTNYSNGYGWNGVSAITESPSGGDITSIYADNIKYVDMVANEDFGLTLEAYQSPEAFDECDGSKSPLAGVTYGQQNRKAFGLAYKTLIGNDTAGNAYGYKLHLVYGCKCSPSERANNTVNDSPDAQQLSWEIKCTPTPTEKSGFKALAHLTISSLKFTETAAAAKLATLLDCIYGKDPTTEGGSDGITPNMPLPDDVVALLTPAS